MLEFMGQQAKNASYFLSSASTAQKNNALSAIKSAILQHQAAILAANQLDVALAHEQQLSASLIDRLTLTPDRIDLILKAIETIIQLPDPVGEIIEGRTVLSGLALEKKRVPLGVIGVIYESRPNVTVDISALCIKTGNGAILRGGKETKNTNQALIKAIHAGLAQAQFPKGAIQFIADSDRALLKALLKLDRYVDMLIPRGGSQLQKLCQTEATMPVILGGIGVCHLYVDESANLEKALNVIMNAKTQRPSTCNSLETLLIHQSKLPAFLPRLSEESLRRNVILHADASCLPPLTALQANVIPLDPEDLTQEWLSLDLNVVVVNDLEHAVNHIRRYGSGHSDGILTEAFFAAEQFINQVDSACVYVNCSTRFSDGAQFGLGSEVAVSTQKLHARGPMGLEALTTYKWIGRGDYLTRA